MMKKIFLLLFISATIFSCRSTKQMSKVIAPKDSTNIVVISIDSLANIENVLADIKSNYIDFKTFSAKIKVEAEDKNGKQPDLIAQVRIIKDSAIWISISATFLNIEVYRILVTPNKVILLNKQDKVVQYRDLSFLQDVIQIPFDFRTMQDLLVGNPVFFPDEITSIKRVDHLILISSIGEFFKHLLTASNDTKLIIQSKLDDVDLSKNSTTTIKYGDYENFAGRMVATSRQIMISEKNKLDVKMKYKQVEFDKDVSVVLNVPRNYTEK